ncbi:hypothetical protein DACRYDRAFT_109804 [Dacryopinax primogenitus]|uniref:F-box domain-containing protein n=1 Tax=Dacryopinax primogenitus (strain DJM 731) TaxID=1858805 RepID=M5FU55_DACPD|nr:uncharacterized protein DACRYDRAFT_109804 [Dacryopinax primogenitus]EJT99698.1 hypothetical protein DACRYDRAFT_109804 [Dacryopinax primogenitus]
MALQKIVALPYDIWKEIVGLVEDRGDLVRLCLVNSLIAPIAGKRLYSSPVLNDIVNTAMFYRTSIGNPTLAEHVTTMKLELDYIFWVGRNFLVGWQEVQAPAYLRLFFRLINQLVNLKELNLRSRESQGRTMSQALSVNLSRMRPRLSSFPFIGLFQCSARPVLRSQTSLESVHLAYCAGNDYAPELVNLSPDTVPQLRRFICDSHSTCQLVRGRPVEEFSLSDEGGYSYISPKDLSSCLAHLQLSLRPLRKLQIGIYALDSTTLVKIQGAMPHIIDLNIKTRAELEAQVRMSYLHLHATDGMQLHQIRSSSALDAFHRFSQLRAFKFTSLVFNNLHAIEISAAVDQIRLACPSLKTVVIRQPEEEDVIFGF